MSLNQRQNSLSSWFCHGIMSAPNPQPAARTIFGAELRSAEVGEGCDAHRVVVTLAFGISSKDRDAEEMELQSNNKCHFLGCYLYYINAIYIYVHVYISIYIYVYVYKYICMYKYIYMHIYTEMEILLGFIQQKWGFHGI